jgi:hypothetical protein
VILTRRQLFAIDHADHVRRTDPVGHARMAKAGLTSAELRVAAYLNRFAGWSFSPGQITAQAGGLAVLPATVGGRPANGTGRYG